MLLALVTNLGVVALFAIPAVALWWHAWSGSLSHTLACACGDSGQQVWFIAWPAYALRHGLDPFFTSALWAPKGVNLLSNASFPLVGVVLSPLTWVAGPIVSTNVALVLAPALSAWACWFTCRRMVGWTPAAWIAGAIFGYSPFIVDNAATGHIGLALLVVPPLLLLVGRGLLLGQGSALKWGLALGTLVIVQYFISSEILVITAVVGAVGVVATLVWSPRSIVTSWRFAGLAMLVGTGLAVVVLAWPAWFQLFGPRHLSGSPWPGIQIQGNRVADLVRAGRTGVPNSLLKLGGYEGPAGPPSVYLGYGLVVVGALAAVFSWRRRATKVLASAWVVTVVFSLGALLWTSRQFPTVWLPWRFLGSLPILDQLGPQRFTAGADLLVAVIVALGLDAVWLRTAHWRTADDPVPGDHRAMVRRGAIGVGLLLVCLGAVIPVWNTYHGPLTTRTTSAPRWVKVLHAAPNKAAPVVVVYPFSMSATLYSQPLVWQSEDGFGFRLVGGYAKVPGPGGHAVSIGAAGSGVRVLAALTSPGAGAVPSGTAKEIKALRRTLVSSDASWVVVTHSGRAPVAAAQIFSAAIGRAPAKIGGTLVWQLTRSGKESRLTAGAAAQALSDCRAFFTRAPHPWQAVRQLGHCISATPSRA